MTPERKEYIKKLESQIEAINRILKMDLNTLINDNVKNQLKQLKQEATIALRKLKNDEFEIAIVGVESAGKSTFVNAFIESDILPYADARCTYTSTKIEYPKNSHHDSAIISFYTTQVFNNDFKDKLKTLGIPHYEKYSFDTLNPNTYTSLYSSNVSSEKKQLYGESIHKDILSIINHVDDITNLLDKPNLSFNSNQIHSGEMTEYITDSVKALAVSGVVIYSQELSTMKNAIIYDVPGFNAPTALHKAQTLKRMEEADAIIVIAKGDEPSLTDEPLKILYESDSDGNLLKDKLFVFANKTERSSTISKNIQITKKEWISKGFIDEWKAENRIFFGCALAHLQSLNLCLDKDGSSRALREFEEKKNQMPHGDGIAMIRAELEKYNHTERFKVLKSRIDRIKANIKKILNEIPLDFDSITNRSYGFEHIAIATAFCCKTPSVVEASLLELRDHIRNYMPKEKPLSKKITKYIMENITKEKYAISDEIIDRAKKQSPYTGTFEDTARIEGDIRKLKFKEMYDDFSDNVINIADKHHADYSEEILDRILTSMGVSNDSPYFSELRTLLEKELSAFRFELSSLGKRPGIYYQSLIERFSRDIYEVLITSQYNTERLRKFYESIDNFFSMAIFYQKTDAVQDLSYTKIAPQDSPFCMTLLFHHYLNITETIRVLSEDILRITELKELSEELKQFIEQAFSSTWGNSQEIISTITNAFSKIQPDTSTDFRKNLLRNVLNKIIESNDEIGSLTDEDFFSNYYEKYHSSIKGGKQYSVADFCCEFNKDIEILQDTLANAFVRAINMEKPFVARETKSIDDILFYIRSEKFTDFLTNNIWKIKYQETTKLDKQHREHEHNAAIIGEIKSILDTLTK